MPAHVTAVRFGRKGEAAGSRVQRRPQAVSASGTEREREAERWSEGEREEEREGREREEKERWDRKKSSSDQSGQR